MDYRDERDALRAQKEALEQELVAARADAEGKAELEKELAAKDKELARLRDATTPRPPRSGMLVATLAAGALVLLATCGGAVVWLRASPARSTEPTAASAPVDVPPVATIVSPAPTASAAASHLPGAVPYRPLRFSFSSGGLARLEKGDDGTDGVVAVVFEDVGGTRSYSVVALTGTPLVERWRLGSYGAQAPRVWSAKGRALIIDHAHLLHVIDTEKGVELATVAGLSDAPARVCIRDEQSWIASVDAKSIGVNLATGAGSVGAQLLKPECSPLPGPKQTGCDSISASFCGGSALSLPGFALKVVLANDRVAVAVGVKSPGTPDVLAAGFDPKTRAVRWRSPIADDDDAEPLGDYPPIVAALDDDLFAAIERHKSSGASILLALDAKTGARRFTYSFPTTDITVVQSIALGGQRVFASRWGKLYVLDRETGKELSVVGL